MSKKKNGQDNSFKIPGDAKDLAKLTLKKFKKESGEYYDSKKDLRRGYYSQVVEYLPESIKLLVWYGNRPEVKEIKDSIYNKITDKGFIKYLKKLVKDGESFDNMDLLPNIIYDIVREAQRAVDAEHVDDPNAKVEYELDDMIELSQLILKKKLKKMAKAGIPENVAFDALSIIPSASILKKSQFYHLRSLFSVLYEHAKKTKFSFEPLVKVLLKDDKDYTGALITFALLERKEKLSNFTDSQRDLFLEITNYSLKTLEDMSKEEIYIILKKYVDIRKNDEAKNKDTNRRFYLASLPSDDYPHITKTIEKICSSDENLKKYF